MRLRNIPGAKDAITGSRYVVQNPAEHKGSWNEVFPKDQPLHIEVGMGKGRFLDGYGETSSRDQLCRN